MVRCTPSPPPKKKKTKQTKKQNQQQKQKQKKQKQKTQKQTKNPTKQNKANKQKQKNKTTTTTTKIKIPKKNKTTENRDKTVMWAKNKQTKTETTQNKTKIANMVNPGAVARNAEDNTLILGQPVRPLYRPTPFVVTPGVPRHRCDATGEDGFEPYVSFSPGGHHGARPLRPLTVEK